MAQAIIMAPKRLNRHEAARRLAVPVAAVARMIQDGTLKTAPGIGNTKAVILESSVDAMVQSIVASEQRAG